MPAQAGIPHQASERPKLDPRFRGDDEVTGTREKNSTIKAK